MLLLEGSHHVIDNRIILFQAVQQTLSHAASDHQGDVLLALIVSFCSQGKMGTLAFLGTRAHRLKGSKPAQPTKDTIFRRSPNGTSIDYGQIRSFCSFRRSPPTSHHQLLNSSRLGLIHLASVCFKKISHGKSIPKMRLRCKAPTGAKHRLVQSKNLSTNWQSTDVLSHPSSWAETSSQAVVSCSIFASRASRAD